MGKLRRQVVESECREQTNNTLGRRERGFGETVRARPLGIRQVVEASRRPDENSLFHQATKRDTRHAARVEVTGTGDALLARDPDGPVTVRVFAQSEMLQFLGRSRQAPRICNACGFVGTGWSATCNLPSPLAIARRKADFLGGARRPG